MTATKLTNLPKNARHWVHNYASDKASNKYWYNQLIIHLDQVERLKIELSYVIETGEIGCFPASEHEILQAYHAIRDYLHATSYFLYLDNDLKGIIGVYRRFRAYAKRMRSNGHHPHQQLITWTNALKGLLEVYHHFKS